MSIFTNPSSATPADIAAYVAGLLDLLGNDDPVAILRQMPPAPAATRTQSRVGQRGLIRAMRCSGVQVGALRG
jgi:hypothetical protein